jgi:transposase
MEDIVSAEQKSDTDQQQFWQMVIETWQASGLSVRQFCKKESLSEPSFYSWRKKLVGDNDGKSQQDEPKPAESKFIEVTIPSNNSVTVELLLTSGNKLRIPAGVDSATLSTVLSVLHQTQLC